MTFDRLVPVMSAGMLITGLYGCGTRDTKPDADSRQPPPRDRRHSNHPRSGLGPADPGQQLLPVADIDRWDKGMAAELQAVDAAGARLKAAKTGMNVGRDDRRAGHDDARGGCAGRRGRRRSL